MKVQCEKFGRRRQGGRRDGGTGGRRNQGEGKPAIQADPAMPTPWWPLPLRHLLTRSQPVSALPQASPGGSPAHYLVVLSQGMPLSARVDPRSSLPLHLPYPYHSPFCQKLKCFASFGPFLASLDFGMWNWRARSLPTQCQRGDVGGKSACANFRLESLINLPLRLCPQHREGKRSGRFQSISRGRVT